MTRQTNMRANNTLTTEQDAPTAILAPITTRLLPAFEAFRVVKKVAWAFIANRPVDECLPIFKPGR